MIKGIADTFTLNNGVAMPYLGLGVFQTKEGEEVINAVNYAIDAGYRHIDTAAIYGNEEGVGQAIVQSNVAREELFITTKLWNDDQGYDKTLRAFELSMKKLQLNYLDLYLIHWPKPLNAETWRAMESLYEQGLIKAIGVSNFTQQHIEGLLKTAKVTPAINQVEYHPYLQQPELKSYCESKHIHYQAWSPLMQGKIFGIDILKEIASRYKKTVAQVVVRWNLQNEVVVMPKSVNNDRIISNANVFDFELSKADMELINGLDKNERIGPDPDNFDF